MKQTLHSESDDTLRLLARKALDFKTNKATFSAMETRTNLICKLIHAYWD